MKKKAAHPQWALDQKRPGTELRCIRSKYYLYEYSSFYDKERKKTRKKTGAYLGMISEEKGIVPPRAVRLRSRIGGWTQKLPAGKYQCRSQSSARSRNTVFPPSSPLNATN